MVGFGYSSKVELPEFLGGLEREASGRIPRVLVQTTKRKGQSIY